MVDEYRRLFQEFHTKRVNLLWRGSTDGFDAAEFRRRRDDRTKTLTLILDTDGTVFGSFTAVKLEAPKESEIQR
jgi:hypothetical protein